MEIVRYANEAGEVDAQISEWEDLGRPLPPCPVCAGEPQHGSTRINDGMDIVTFVQCRSCGLRLEGFGDHDLREDASFQWWRLFCRPSR